MSNFKIEFKKIWKEIKLNKEGLGIGAVVGLMIAQYIKMQPTMINLAMESQGMLDGLFTGTAPLDLAKYKVTAIIVIIFAALGFLVDKIIEPKK